MPVIDGGCHCRNIDYKLDWPDASMEIPVRECGCLFCRKHGGSWTSHQAASLRVTIRDPGLVSDYQFATATAVFHVCSNCGAVPFVTSRIDDHWYAVVNTNTFDNADQITLSRSATDFSGEDVGYRLKRRQRNWIPDVQVMSDSA